MAITVEGSKLTEQHREAQLGLRAATIRDLTRIWPMFDGSDASFAEFAATAATLAQARHNDSAGLASAYYSRFRGAEGAAGEMTPRRPGRLASELIQVALLATGLVGTRKALGAGKTSEQARESGLVQAAGALSRLVLNGGRDTVDDSVKADPEALGWIRVTSGSPCAFCAMLASRGPAYKTERTSRFQSHDHCGCGSEPFYRGSKLPEINRQMERLWADAAAGKDDQLNRFRRALAEQRRDATPVNEPSLPVPPPRAPELSAPLPEPAVVPPAVPVEPLTATADVDNYVNGLVDPAQLNEPELRAVEDYQSVDGYQPIQDALREGRRPDDPQYAAAIEHLDALFDGVPLTDRPLVVSRGVQHVDFLPDGDVIGARMTDDAYMSTSSQRDVADIYAAEGAGEGVVMTIDVPEGSRLLPVDHVLRGRASQDDGVDSIGEILLPRGSTLEITSDTMGTNMFGRPVRQLGARLVPSGESL